MYRWLMYIMLAWLSPLAVVAQSTPGLLADSTTLVTGEFVGFGLDALNNLYAVDKIGRLNQYDQEGRLRFWYYDSTLGRPAPPDLSNPFNLLLYYPDYQTIVLLDRTLNERARLDLRTTDLLNATTVARSWDDRIWVYDNANYRLKKIAATGEISFTTDDLQLLLGQADAPAHILVDRNQVLLYWPGAGMAVFTNFGQYQHWIALPPTQVWEWSGSDLYFYTEHGWRVWNTNRGLQELATDWNEALATAHQRYWTRDRVYWLTAAGISVSKR